MVAQKFTSSISPTSVSGMKLHILLRAGCLPRQRRKPLWIFFSFTENQMKLTKSLSAMAAIASILFISLAIVSPTSARILAEQPGSGSGSGSGGLAPIAPGAVATGADPSHTLTFFMHDILGGSIPSARAVTGIVTNPAVNGQLPFSKPNGAVLPFNNGVPQNNGNNGLLNNNNIPFITGLSGMSTQILQNNGRNFFTNGGAGLPVVNGGQLSAGSTLQGLMFGTMTAIDDELTEGHELGSGMVGKAQGFYVVSSVDGTSQTMAFTAMFESGSYEDSLSFFGVHRTGVSESYLAIMGGTGKYVNAKGFASVKTFPVTDQHAESDGQETLLEFAVYVTY